jgi:hypothetical protein
MFPQLRQSSAAISANHPAVAIKTSS